MTIEPRQKLRTQRGSANATGELSRVSALARTDDVRERWKTAGE
jgi:hypothetical protein